jgi:branched-chain amino acid transport system substrate-binding protein
MSRWRGSVHLRIAAFICLVSVVATGCGTRRTDADLAAAARGAAANEAGSTVSTGGDVAAGGPTESTEATSPGLEATTGPTGGRSDSPGPDAAGSRTTASVASRGPAATSDSRRASAGDTSATGATQPARQSAAGPSPAAVGNSGSQPKAGSPRGSISIGSVGTLSGVLGEMSKGSVPAVQAWAKWMNDRGGVAGHLIEVSVIDDGGDPARHRAAIQQLVEQHGAIAIVNDLGIQGLQEDSIRYLEQKRVPVVGGDALNELWYSSPMVFPQMPAGNAKLWSQMVAAVNTAGKGSKFGLITCQEAQICRDAVRWWPEYAKRLGLQVAYQTQVSLTQPNFTAECLAARNAGVEILFLGLDTNSERRVAANCSQQGYHPTFGLVQTNAGMAAEGGFDGSVFPSNVFPWMVTDTPAAAEFHQVMARYAPNQPLSYDVATGWVAAKLFERATAKLGENPTGEDVLRGLWSLRDDTLGGLTAPLTFPEGQKASPTFCYWPVRIKGGQWTAPQGSQPICQSRQ